MTDRFTRRRQQQQHNPGYEQNLLSDDYLSSSSIHHDYSNKRSQRRRVRYTNDTIELSPIHSLSSSYVPPNPGYENDTDYRQQQVVSALSIYRPTTHQSPSIRRAILAQTPSRTTGYNDDRDSDGDDGNNIRSGELRKVKEQVLNQHNPAVDLGATSCFSYGCFCFQCVRTTEVGVVENCGRFETFLGPGLHIIPWPIVDIGGRLSLRIQLIEVNTETRTSDQVFLTLTTTISYRVITERSYDAYYRLSNPHDQISSHVFDVVRSTIPKLTLDGVFASKGLVAGEVVGRLGSVMAEYGYEILDALVTDIRLCEVAVESMSEIHVAKRLKIATAHKAEAEKIKVIKEAEAHCESLYLSGIGVANQRKALAKEMKKSLARQQSTSAATAAAAYPWAGDDENPTTTDSSNSARDVMNMLLMTQYLDMMVTVSGPNNGNDGTNNLIMDADPGFVRDLQKQLQTLSS